MKDKIIDQLSEKKSPNGAEAFFLICANAEKLSPQFRKTFNAMVIPPFLTVHLGRIC